MKNMTKLMKFMVVGIFSTLVFSCSDDDSSNNAKTISQIAVETPQLSSLVAALQKAGLVETLGEAGPFTVFAPTNDAFNNFLQANNFDSLEDVPTPLLKEVLLNHVISGNFKSTDLTTGYIKTLGKGSASATNTLSMFVNTTSGVRLNGVSSVSTANVMASNGVVHIVDAVIGLPTVVTHATANSNFSTLATLLTQQGLVSTLSGTANSPFTVFAPVESAFNQATLDLYGGLTSTQKTEVLTYHVVTGANVLSNAIPTGNINTFQGQGFTITGTSINDAGSTTNKNIILTDVQCSNGIIHAIDGVLLPSFN